MYRLLAFVIADILFVIANPWLVIADILFVVANPWLVIADLIRNPCSPNTWIPGQARYDKVKTAISR